MEFCQDIAYSQPRHFPNDIIYSYGYRVKLRNTEIFKLRLILFSGRGQIFNKLYSHLNLADSKYSIDNWGLQKKIKYSVKSLKNFKIYFGNVILIFDDWSNNIYHFTVDFLSKLEYLRSIVDFGTEYTLILPNTHFSKNTGVYLLKYLQFDLKIKFVERESLNFVMGNLVTTSQITSNGTSNRKIVASLFRKIQKPLQLENCKNIYYFRTGDKRKIVNNDEVIMFFRSKGFICLDFNNTTIEQVHFLLSNSKCIVGLHGAGLTNMIFLPKGAKVLEFKTNNSTPKNHCYWHLAENLGMAYSVFLVDSIDPHNNILEGSKGVDVMVDLNLLSSCWDDLGI